MPRDPYRLPQLVDPIRDWRELGACAQIGGEAFYQGKGSDPEPAKKVCAGCEVRAQCLEQALQTPIDADYGIWGGTTMRERRVLRRERKGAA